MIERSLLKKGLPKTGFTLIELLVIIAIIGILSTVVFTNLAQARKKASDSAMMSNLRDLQTYSNEYFIDKNGDFSNFCDDAKASALLTNGGKEVDRVCNNKAEAWCAYSIFKSSPSLTFCVDSSGKKGKFPYSNVLGSCYGTYVRFTCQI